MISKSMKKKKIYFSPQIPISECGKSLGCFRHCKTEPECEADDTELIVTMGMDDRADPKQPEIEFRIGGKLFDNKSVSIN